ncbi:MAG: septation protein A [Pseudomonadales bacterium]|jgi:intracellular septation protein|nr:septation protein A [Pseudomonadales bacterium]MCP5334001.1 septation protein A [Pseudomonadales bacterium]HMU90566.1 septation protein A [Pseudomonadales bacterium]HMW14092.1 septation protein A [Pseudomonadales bacterium]HMW82120.1 septation protein A [Pseudomonadales bacterium]
MKQLLEFIPLLAFFAAYKLYDIYIATAVLIIATSLHYGILWLVERKLDKTQRWTWIGVVLFGGLTLALGDDTYIKWKAPVLDWLFALAFLGSQLFGEKSLVERLMGNAVSLPKTIWNRLNLSWVIFFAATGFANLYVVFYHPEFWVDFKVFGSLGLTLLFMVGQAIYLVRHITPEAVEEQGKQ